MLINALRGLVKSAGSRLPSCSTESLAVRAPAHIPSALAAAGRPLLEQIVALNGQIAGLDREIEKLREKYPEIGVLRTVPGVGPVVAAAYVLTLDRCRCRPATARRAPFWAFVPAQKQSGDTDPQMRISKDGDRYLRSLLVQSAQYILGRFGPDSSFAPLGVETGREAAASGAKSEPWWPWPANWPCCCTACGAAASASRPFRNRRRLRHSASPPATGMRCTSTVVQPERRP